MVRKLNSEQMQSLLFKEWSQRWKKGEILKKKGPACEGRRSREGRSVRSGHKTLVQYETPAPYGETEQGGAEP